jgi:hypothetical protein
MIARFSVILSAAKDLARSAYASRRNARRDSSLQQLSLRMTQEKGARKKETATLHACRLNRGTLTYRRLRPPASSPVK